MQLTVHLKQYERLLGMISEAELEGLVTDSKPETEQEEAARQKRQIRVVERRNFFRQRIIELDRDTQMRSSAPPKASAAPQK